MTDNTSPMKSLYRSIWQRQLNYVNNSGVSVDENRSQSWVTITDTDGGELFLQGEDAEIFTTEADQYEEAAQVSRHDALLLAAYNYLDAL